MLDTKRIVQVWLESLDGYETRCLGMYFHSCGYKTNEDYFKLIYKLLDYYFSIIEVSKDIVQDLLNMGKELNFRKIDEILAPGIGSALYKLISIQLQEDLHNKQIDFQLLEKTFFPLFEKFPGSKEKYDEIQTQRRIEEILSIEFSKNRWPYKRYQLDELYKGLLDLRFIDPVGHFSGMFLSDFPPPEHRIHWKTNNRTDLVYLGYRLYNKDYKIKYYVPVTRIFYTLRRDESVAELIDYRDTRYTIQADFEYSNHLKSNWRKIDNLLKQIGI